jgi:hypothetical protein
VRKIQTIETKSRGMAIELSDTRDSTVRRQEKEVFPTWVIRLASSRR